MSDGIARGARPDAETSTSVVLLKNVSEMRATYQIRLLAYIAMERKKELAIYVPAKCEIHESLMALMDKVPGVVRIVRR